MAEITNLKIHTSQGPATLSLTQEGWSTFRVVDFEVEGAPELSFAFSRKGSGVENLDVTSDVAQCFGLSTRVQYGDVVLGTDEIRARSLEELMYALKQVKVIAFNHEDI